MLSLKLAYKNLVGAGLRTWLNAIVLSFSFVMIIWFKGMLDGWDRQARADSIAWEIGGGQYWHENYDPDDPFTLTESHAKLGREQQDLIEKKQLVPILITRGTMYPEGRMQNILIKGIDVHQDILSLPTSRLDTVISAIPALIGSGLASDNNLSEGDRMMIRWRDTNGTFDADEVLIAGIFETNVPGIDAGQIWIPLERLENMMLLPENATILVKDNSEGDITNFKGWIFKDHNYLLQDIDKIIKSKSAGGSVFYLILLLLAMLAIFDTQVLSVFRRQKEIGTYIALGMSKGEVISLFTIEGALHSVLAVMIGAIYGIPLFLQQSRNGISFGMESKDFGITMAETMYPLYTIELVLVTIFIIMLTTTLVSFLPARKISRMNPTEAIKGKIQ